MLEGEQRALKCLLASMLEKFPALQLGDMVLQELWILLGKSAEDGESMEKRLKDVLCTVRENLPVKALQGKNVRNVSTCTSLNQLVTCHDIPRKVMTYHDKTHGFVTKPPKCRLISYTTMFSERLQDVWIARISIKIL